MSLHERAKQDIQTITSNSLEFGVPVLFVSPLSESITVNCLPSNHHTGFDSDGTRVNSKMASIAVSEQLLIDEGYTYRNAKNEITFKDHIITLEGVKFVAREWFPDETVGLIILILGERA